MTTLYQPKTIYDRRLDAWFGRVETWINGKMVDYRVVRRHRVCKSEALRDAEYVADVAYRLGKVDCNVVY